MVARNRTSPRTSGLFASGFLIPLRADGLGGFVLGEGEEYVRQQVLGAVSPGDSGNPFQGSLSTSAGVFENPTDPGWKRAVGQMIRQNMQVLEDHNLARLLDLSFAPTKPKDNTSGDYTINIVYLNLETGREGSANIQALEEGESNLAPVPRPISR